MDWVLDHLQVLFVIAVAAVAVLQKLKQAARTGQTAGEPPAVDLLQAERTRRIQEEIRRRIMERRGLAPPPLKPESLEEPPPLPAPPPLVEEVRPYAVPPSLEQTTEESRAASDPALEFERQQQMLQQFHDLEAREARERALSAAGAGAAASASGAPRPANRIVADLRAPASLRRAVVLREILGPPVGLR